MSLPISDGIRHVCSRYIIRWCPRYADEMRCNLIFDFGWRKRANHKRICKNLLAIHNKEKLIWSIASDELVTHIRNDENGQQHRQEAASAACGTRPTSRFDWIEHDKWQRHSTEPICSSKICCFHSLSRMENCSPLTHRRIIATTIWAHLSFVSVLNTNVVLTAHVPLMANGSRSVCGHRGVWFKINFVALDPFFP